jgi:hypothetical protein
MQKEPIPFHLKKTKWFLMVFVSLILFGFSFWFLSIYQQASSDSSLSPSSRQYLRGARVQGMVLLIGGILFFSRGVYRLAFRKPDVLLSDEGIAVGFLMGGSVFLKWTDIECVNWRLKSKNLRVYPVAIKKYFFRNPFLVFNNGLLSGFIQIPLISIEEKTEDLKKIILERQYLSLDKWKES